MTEDLERRISAALDRGGRAGLERGLTADPDLRRVLESDPKAAAYARDLERLDALLADWPPIRVGEDAMEALARRIEQRLDERLPNISDPTLPPVFDDETAGAPNAERRDGLQRDGLQIAGAVAIEANGDAAERVSASEILTSGELEILDDLASGSAAPDAPASRPVAADAARSPAQREIPKLVTLAEATGRRISLPSIAPQTPPAAASVAMPSEAPTSARSRWRAPLAVAAAVVLGVVGASRWMTRGAPEQVVASPGAGRWHPPVPTPRAEGLAPAAGMLAPVTAAANPAPPAAAAPLEPEAHAVPPAPTRAGDSADVDGMPSLVEASSAEPPLSPQSGRERAAERRRGAQATDGAPLPAMRPGSAAAGSVSRQVHDPPAITAAPAAQMPAPSGAAARGVEDHDRAASGGARAAGAGAPPSDLPATPDREAVLAAMQSIHPAIHACAQGQHGQVTVRIVVAGSGRVQSALVTGAFAGSPVGSCIARAVRTARLPPFASPRFEFTYPIVL